MNAKEISEMEKAAERSKISWWDITKTAHEELIIHPTVNYENGFKAGANWQKERCKELERVIDLFLSRDIIRTTQYITYCEDFIRIKKALCEYRGEK